RASISAIALLHSSAAGPSLREGVRDLPPNCHRRPGHAAPIVAGVPPLDIGPGPDPALVMIGAFSVWEYQPNSLVWGSTGICSWYGVV
uniref:Uncharacterized protein n=1 Tax=Chrysemys picta bellii TaxID=8478 RepID=A0A8C3P9Y6_CHRPI